MTFEWAQFIRWSCERVAGASYFSRPVQDDRRSPWRWRARRRYTDTMLNREACERRVYRLATLLTGNPVAATRVIESVVDAQPDLRRLDNTHMDRLTVLRSRELTPGRLVLETVPPAAAAALALLTSPQRAPWVFTHVSLLARRVPARGRHSPGTSTPRPRPSSLVRSPFHGLSTIAVRRDLSVSRIRSIASAIERLRHVVE